MENFAAINDSAFKSLKPPSIAYKLLLLALFAGIAMLLIVWIYQMKRGMGVAGISHPVGWGTYIGNFVFWIGIAHSGTLISAILLLVRAKWRTAVSRSAEAMTLFAIMTAGLFPLIHLGRFWVFYYILPYPSQRQIWPNFISPLVWDVCAVFTYFCVSTIFFYVGMIPDAAAARDYLETHRPNSLLKRLYGWAALGWFGESQQWRHHQRAYLFFAMLATPLVVSVHSVVSWDFAMGLLPGWHETLFAPYFVAGAIHSGLAMVLTLLIPLRRILHLEDLIKPRDFEAVALTMLVTTLIVLYAYVVEPFMAWYSQDIFDQQFSAWRFGPSMGWIYVVLYTCNIALPLLFTFKKVRTNLYLLFIISILVNIGMWSERLWIVTTATSHDFMPHAWGPYAPTWVEYMILLGSFCFFFFWFLNYAKFLPTVPVSDIKKDQVPEEPQVRRPVHIDSAQLTTGVTGFYLRQEPFVDAIYSMSDLAAYGMNIFTPMKISAVDHATGRRNSPVWLWTLIGTIAGVVCGFWLGIWAGQLNGLIVGGKRPWAIIPLCIIGFEGGVLFGAFANLIGLLLHSGIWRQKKLAGYSPEFSRDRMGLFVACPPEACSDLAKALKTTDPEDIRVFQ